MRWWLKFGPSVSCCVYDKPKKYATLASQHSLNVRDLGITWVVATVVLVGFFVWPKCLITSYHRAILSPLSLSLSLSHFSLFSSFLNSIYLSIYHSINWYSIAADPEAAIGFVHKEPYVTANHALTLCSVKMASASAMLQSLQTPFGLRQASPDRNVFSGSPDHAGRLKLSPDNVL